MNKDYGIVYLLQAPGFIGTDRYKIGCSSKNNLERPLQYGKGTRYLQINEVKKPFVLEEIIKKSFKNNFNLVAGKELFSGDERKMIRLFSDIVQDYLDKYENDDSLTLPETEKTIITQIPMGSRSDDNNLINQNDNNLNDNIKKNNTNDINTNDFNTNDFNIYELDISNNNIKDNELEKNIKLSPYQKFKLEFEKTHFLLQGKLVQIINDKLYCFNLNEAKAKYKSLNWFEDIHTNNDKIKNKKKIKKYFLNEWFEDPKRRYYENVDFIPNTEKCPETTYNLFTGFAAEKYKPETPLSEEEILNNIEPIIFHINLLTKGHADWMCLWLANIFQYPDIKNDINPLIRDQSGLFEQCGGTGKNLLFETVGNDLIGEKYFIVVGDNKTLYGDFNSQFEGKLLIMIEEANSKDNHSNLEMLNSKITNKKLNINKKGVVQYDVKDYSRYVFTTNNRNAIPIGNGNRRIAVFDTNNQKRGNTEYFENLVNHLENPIVKWSFYYYLRYMINILKSPIQYQNSIPLTNAYIEMKKLNAPLYIKWILSMIYNGTIVNNNVRSLYLSFRNWVKETKEGKEENIITETAFGLLLNSSKDANEEYEVTELGTKKKNSSGTMFFTWNINGVINALKKLNLIENDFVYETCEQKIKNQNQKLEEKQDNINDTINQNILITNITQNIHYEGSSIENINGPIDKFVTKK